MQFSCLSTFIYITASLYLLTHGHCKLDGIIFYVQFCVRVIFFWFCVLTIHVYRKVQQKFIHFYYDEKNKSNVINACNLQWLWAVFSFSIASGIINIADIML